MTEENDITTWGTQERVTTRKTCDLFLGRILSSVRTYKKKKKTRNCKRDLVQFSTCARINYRYLYEQVF